MNYIQYMQTPYAPIMAQDNTIVPASEQIRPIIHELATTPGYLTWAAHKANPNIEEYQKVLALTQKARPVMSQGKEMTEQEKRASQQRLELYGQIQKEAEDRRKAAEVAVTALDYLSPSYYANKAGANLTGAEAFLFDMTADPTNYLSAGILPLTKMALKEGTEAAVKQAAKTVASEAAEKAAKESAQTIATREVGDLWQRLKLFNDPAKIDGKTLSEIQSNPYAFLKSQWAKVSKTGDAGEATAPLVYKGKGIIIDPNDHSIITMADEDFNKISRTVTKNNADHPDYDWDLGDINDAAYFDLDPAEVAFMKKADYLGMPEGSRVVMFSDGALSTDSYPLLLADITRKHGKQGTGFFDWDGTRVTYQKLNDSGRSHFQGLDDSMQRSAMVQRLQQAVDRTTSALGGPKLKVIYDPVEDAYYVPNIGFKKGASQPVVDPRNNRMYTIYDIFRNSGQNVDWTSFFGNMSDLAAMAEHRAVQAGKTFDIQDFIKNIQTRAAEQGSNAKIDFNKILQQEREQFIKDFGDFDASTLRKNFIANNIDFQKYGGIINYLNYSK